MYGPLTPVSYCHVSPVSTEEGMQFDLLLMDEAGKPAIRFQCLSGRDLAGAQTGRPAVNPGAAAGTYDLPGSDADQAAGGRGWN